MYMCMCMCMCVNARMYVCVYVWMDGWMDGWIYIYIRMYVCIYVCVYMYICVCMRRERESVTFRISAPGMPEGSPRGRFTSTETGAEDWGHVASVTSEDFRYMLQDSPSLANGFVKALCCAALVEHHSCYFFSTWGAAAWTEARIYGEEE